MLVSTRQASLLPARKALTLKVVLGWTDFYPDV